MSPIIKAIVIAVLVATAPVQAEDLAGNRAGKAGSAPSSVRDSIDRWFLDVEVRREIDAFAADPRHGRFEEVRELMADLLGAASARREVMSLEEAYAQACEIRDRGIPSQKKTAPGSSRI
mgnify:CR=1 FL=1